MTAPLLVLKYFYSFSRFDKRGFHFRLDNNQFPSIEIMIIYSLPV